MTNEEHIYCEDYCPIYQAIKDYNEGRNHKIYCIPSMCEHISKAVDANNREVKADGRTC